MDDLGCTLRLFGEVAASYPRALCRWLPSLVRRRSGSAICGLKVSRSSSRLHKDSTHVLRCGVKFSEILDISLGSLLIPSARQDVPSDLSTTEALGGSPRVIMCFELDSNVETTDAKESFWDEVAGSPSGSATPRDRKIWEDVVPTASCVEAVSKVVEWYDTTGIVNYFLS